MPPDFAGRFAPCYVMPSHVHRVLAYPMRIVCLLMPWFVFYIMNLLLSPSGKARLITEAYLKGRSYDLRNTPSPWPRFFAFRAVLVFSSSWKPQEGQ